MSDKPTFHLCDDYVALMELRPAARTVYMLLRCNASFGRHGVVEHAVHVTGQWFTEMTSHWENPLPPSTARRGLNELIDKGVLIRLNDSKDGSGFIVAFVADPRGRIEGPANGFNQAKRVAKRCGPTVYYDRKDERPGIPAVTGIRLTSRYVPPSDDAEGEPAAQPQPAEEPQNAPEPQPPVKPEIRPQGTPVMRDFAEALEEVTAQKADPKLRLMTGACTRLAETYREALEQGWDPKALAKRLASELNPRINSPERFLVSKAADLGAPPKAAIPGAPAPVDLGVDGIGEADMRRGRSSNDDPSSTEDPDDAAKRAQIVREYQKNKARRTMSGPGINRS